MDVLLLGAAAIVLIVLTVLIVWRAPSESVRSEDTTTMMPQGDNFEDQYTSATADLSAGGVAITTAARGEPAPVTEVPPVVTSETLTTTPVSEAWTVAEVVSEPETTRQRGKTIGLGAAALLTVSGAAAGAWLYARWQRERNKPFNRLRRRFR